MKARRVVSNLLLLAGLGLIGYCAYVWIDAEVFQAQAERNFSASLRPPDLHAPPLALPKPQTGEIVGKLEIPRLGVSVMVVEGDDNHDLKRAAGHIPGTAFPGSSGNVGIAAHRDTFFRPLRSIRDGDAIAVDTLTGVYRYRVVSVRIVGPDDNQVLAPTSHASLTLVTCYPFYYVGPAPRRFVVRAELVGPVERHAS